MLRKIHTDIFVPVTNNTNNGLEALNQSGHQRIHTPLTEPIHHDAGNIGFMILASTMLWIMIPGYGLFYSGIARSKSALSMIVLSFWSIVIVSIQWFVFGYSLSFSKSSSSLIGNFDKMFLIGVYDKQFGTAEGIPELAFCLYQGVTAILPCSLIMGALAERARVLPALVFIFLWNTLVYNPICYWSLNPNGWSYRIGVLDFGGGAPVHVPAGASALAYSYILGPRDREDRAAKPHNMGNVLIGTILIWFGSFGYNAGSAFAPDLQALMSCFLTNLSACFGALTWNIMDYITEKKCTAFGLCAGAVVGLIVITPASGFIHPGSCAAFGIIGSLACRWAHGLKDSFKFDDALDVFAVHGFAGIIGVLLTGIFAQKEYGGEEVGNGGWLNGHWFQVVLQLSDIVAGFLWSFLVSLALLALMNKIPFLRLRMDTNHEKYGVDTMELGVACYEHVEDIKMESMQLLSINPIEVNSIPNLITNDTNQDFRGKNNGNDKSENNIRVVSHRHNNWRNYWY